MPGKTLHRTRSHIAETKVLHTRRKESVSNYVYQTALLVFDVFISVVITLPSSGDAWQLSDEWLLHQLKEIIRSDHWLYVYRYTYYNRKDHLRVNQR